jgi:hypothetical protein
VGEPDDNSEAVATDIRNYLDRFPEARDTARGIQEWWLPPCRREIPLAALERLLWRLVDEGHLAASKLPNGTILFAGKPRASAERN